MQNVYSKSAGGCPSTLTTGKAYALTDQRDSRTYYVARLADGNCWMLQNLRIGQSTSSKALTSTLSDVSSSGFTLNGKLSDGKFTYTTVDGVAMQNNSSQYYCTTNYGCYYNWYTATAGSGTTSASSGNVNYSICPKGWTLPTQSEWSALTTAYGGTGSTGYNALLVSNPTTTTENVNGANAPGLLLGKYYGSSGINNNGIAQGVYWSRSAYSEQITYAMLFRTSDKVVVPDNRNFDKYWGVSLRCILK